VTLIPTAPPPACTPPMAPSQLMVTDLPMFTVPKPPESRQSISPPAAVRVSARAKVRQGDVRVQLLPSFPTPDTQLRVACA
jgi:hypothetical protein